MYQNDIDVFLEKLDIDIKDYEEAQSTSTKSKIVVLKRTLHERNVNNYNREFLLAWRANMDLQFCYDSYAVATYITDYLTKADAGLTKALRDALHESKGCNNLDRLNYVKRAYFTHRQVSVAEATYRLTDGMSLKASNVKSKFVATGYLENRSNFYCKVNDEDDEDDEESDEDNKINTDSEDNDDQAEGLKPRRTYIIPGRTGKFVKAETIHEKYAN